MLERKNFVLGSVLYQLMREIELDYLSLYILVIAIVVFSDHTISTNVIAYCLLTTINYYVSGRRQTQINRFFLYSVNQDFLKSKMV